MHNVSLKSVFNTWWPLAASWLFMGVELPLVSAVMARLPDPKISLAAYGGVVFQLALIIEAPIIMLLAASTALSKDTASYRKLYQFMMWTGGLLTVLHLVVAFTPLFDIIVVRWMAVPAEIIEPARLGLRIMTPWTWTIAYRRFNQGLLIRFGHSRAISTGTMLRISANAFVLWLGWRDGTLPGIAIGTAGIAAGVIVEAVYAGLQARPVIRGALATALPVSPPLTWTAFYGFYIPLAATSMINLVVQPMGSAAISRMPVALESLAVWPVLGGFLFIWRSMGFAYNEVVVAQLDDPGAAAVLKRFTLVLSLAATGIVLLAAATPFARFWFSDVSGLDADLVALAGAGLWLGLFWPALSIIQNFYQGVIVHSRKTNGLTISIIISVLTTAVCLAWGVFSGQLPGLHIGLIAFQAGQVTQAAYLWWICRPVLRMHLHADAHSHPEVVPIQLDG